MIGKRALVPPTLTTARLVLEPLSFAHSAGMFAMWSRPEVCRHSGPARDFEGRPIRLPAETPADSDRIIDFFVRSAAEGTRFRWALMDRADRTFLGAAGFNNLGSCSEYGYHLRPESWGQGFMAEASAAAIGWLRQRPGSLAVDAFIEPDNLPSIRHAERLGLHPTGEGVNGALRYLMSLQG